MSPRRTFPRAAALAAALSAALTGLLALPATGGADLQSQIAAGRAATAALRRQIAADDVQIGQTTAGLHAAQARLAGLQSELSARTAALHRVQVDLLRARNHLVDLENELSRSTRTLAANLVAQYENQPPNLMTVILEAHGFRSLLEQVDFARRIARQDARIVAATREARVAVSRQAAALAGLEARDVNLTRQVLRRRDEVAALQGALLERQISQLAVRGRVASRLGSLNDRLRTLQAQENAIEAAAAARAAAAVRAAAQPATTPAGASGVGIALDAGGMVQPPAGAPQAVREVIAAGNAIATMPYIYGGGHGSFQANGYDCSGSVSYALAAAGLVSSPLDSTGFESWGLPGPGRWITVYANADHAWMEVAGWRFDTVAQASSGTRWAQGGGEFSGFVERHPAGL